MNYLFQSYIHRSGRTARASKEGLSVMLIDPSETQLYRKMCRTLNRGENSILLEHNSRIERLDTGNLI